MARPPKPTNLKLVTGNPGKRALNRQEPDPDYLQDLTPPAHLSERAAAVWRELAQPLRNARVLTVMDAVALEMVCNAIATYRMAAQQATDKPLAKSPETGAVSLSPWAIVQSMAFKQATGLLREFGMTPAARARVVTNGQGDLFGNDNENPAAQYF